MKTKFKRLISILSALCITLMMIPMTALTAVAATVPSPPIISASAGDGRAAITISVLSDGGSPITGYNYTITPAGGTPTTVTNTTATQFTFSSLTNGIEYSFTATAENAVGTSLPSNPVTATPISSAKDITSFIIGSSVGAISGTDIDVTVPYGTDVTNLIPTIGVSEGATVTPTSGSAQNFANNVLYDVTAQNNNSKTYTVMVHVATASTKCDITSFKIGSSVGTIIGTNISVTVPYGTDVKSLIPTIEISKYATISPASLIAKDFTTPVNYIVEAQNGDKQTYKVTVIVASQTAPVVTPAPTTNAPTATTTTAATTTAETKPEPKIGGTTGWAKLEEKILKTAAGGTVPIDMNGTTSVPQSIFSDIKGKDVTVELDFGTYSWEINGNDITSANSVDLGVSYTPSVINPDLVDGVAGDAPSIQLQLNYNGSFGFTGKLTVQLPDTMAGQYANLYYYNPETKKLELYASALIGADGTATFIFTHASDYVVVMEKTAKSSNLAAGESATDSAKPIAQNGMPYIIISSVLIFAGIAVKKYKKSRS